MILMKNTPCGLCGTLDRLPALSVADRYASGLKFDIVRCAKCGLMSTDPRPDAAEIQEYYPAGYYAGQEAPYEGIFAGARGLLDPLKNWLKKAVLRTHYGYFSETGPASCLARFLTRPFKYRMEIFPERVKTGRVLDIGCGAGHYLYKLKGLGWETTGVEFDAAASARAREEGGLNVITADFLKCELPENSFDAVTLWHSLEHFYDPLAAAEKIFRLLKPGGRLIAGLPDADSAEARFFGKYWWAWEVPRHLYHFTAGTAAALLERAGFSGVTVEYPPNVNNLMLSLGNYFADKFPARSARARAFFDPAQNFVFVRFMAPAAWALAASGQIGRMVVYAVKQEGKK